MKLQYFKKFSGSHVRVTWSRGYHAHPGACNTVPKLVQLGYEPLWLQVWWLSGCHGKEMQGVGAPLLIMVVALHGRERGTNSVFPYSPLWFIVLDICVFIALIDVFTLLIRVLVQLVEECLREVKKLCEFLLSLFCHKDELSVWVGSSKCL